MPSAELRITSAAVNPGDVARTVILPRPAAERTTATALPWYNFTWLAVAATAIHKIRVAHRDEPSGARHFEGDRPGGVRHSIAVSIHHLHRDRGYLASAVRESFQIRAQLQPFRLARWTSTQSARRPRRLFCPALPPSRLRSAPPKAARASGGRRSAFHPGSGRSAPIPRSRSSCRSRLEYSFAGRRSSPSAPPVWCGPDSSATRPYAIHRSLRPRRRRRPWACRSRAPGGDSPPASRIPPDRASPTRTRGWDTVRASPR